MTEYISYVIVFLVFFILIFCIFFVFFFFFFFSSRRRHTRWNCDWSSDVCSSDLPAGREPSARRMAVRRSSAPTERLPVSSRLTRTETGPTGTFVRTCAIGIPRSGPAWAACPPRSEERRVGKECRSLWWPYH